MEKETLEQIFDKAFERHELKKLIKEELFKAINDAEFESKHPRNPDGTFARGGGESVSHTPSKAYTEILEKIKKDNAKNISPDDIINNAIKSYGLNPVYVKSRILYADKYTEKIRKNNSETKNRFSENGIYTEERAQKHKEILNKIFANKDKARPREGEAPKAIFLGGRGGSGKSKFNGLVYNKENYIVLDADEIKKSLEEYKGFNAFEVHEESSDILKSALDMAQSENLNVVLDATMKSLGSTEKKIKSFSDSGYNIEMYYMHLPRELAAERAINRYINDQNGRYVPLDVLLEMKDNEENFDKLKKYASKWAFYNNDVPRKEDKPILVDKNY